MSEDQIEPDPPGPPGPGVDKATDSVAGVAAAMVAGGEAEANPPAMGLVEEAPATGQPDEPGGKPDGRRSDTSREAPSADPRPRAQRHDQDKPARDRPPTGGSIAEAVFNFYGEVKAEAVGLAPGGSGRGGRRAETGRLTESEVTTQTDRYAQPDCFDEAAGLLRQERVLVLEGPPGTGRRSGAINLLRAVTDDRLVALSPMVSLRKLAEHEYHPGYGYLVVDRRSDGNPADVDFTWANVVDQVCEGEAYLVLTSTTVAVRAADRAVRHVTWQRPPAAAVLRAQLTGRGYRQDAIEDLVARLIAELPDTCPLTRLVDLAVLVVDKGMEPAEALQHWTKTAGREVQTWFAETPSHREVVEVAALGFLEGTDVRSFETLLSGLQKAMVKRMAVPAKKARAIWQDENLFADRSARAAGAGLIEVEDRESHTGPTRAVVFKDKAYGRFVLDQLWRSRSTAFWDAIREWLDEIVAGGVSVSVAQGLAKLACASFEEVERSYLDPWSWGRVGWSGQVTSTYVLWYLCQLDGLAAAALHTAVRWANGSDVDRRWTALVAFAGDLGVCYPTEAANRLWQLTAQSNDLSAAGCTALGCLFATLVDESPDNANVVLNLLSRKMERFGTGHGGGRMQANALMRMRSLTMAASLAVVSASSARTRRSALFEYLPAHRDRLPLAARICAGVFRFRPFRRQALISLRRGLHALRDISEDPHAQARAFGAALSDALPPEERAPLRTDFTRIDEQLRRGKRDSPAEVLLACLEAISTSVNTGGTR
jgi:hypothetical protein